MELLGRVTTGIETIITIAMPLGSIFGGWILEILAPSYSLIFSGISVIATAFFYCKSKNIKYLPKFSKLQRIIVEK